MGATVLTFTDAAVPTSGAPLGSPGTHPSGHPARPQLRLVPAGRQAAETARSERPRLRLTRFGRLTVTVATLAVVIALGVGLVGQLASTGFEGRPVTVESGQTLSEIAARELPDVPVREGVVSLQLANGLSTDQVHAGQRLLVP
ncbi:MAG: LysM peptidoglycan-binding domain-containing protein [Humibacillus sp.]|nr:LysM peptidoglycan-binding domain-containing protein [Humibacillus sp.]MDN5776449.1 LysM peptidoglycan-binding domain-containing protein [Humibacillus sp.]